MTTEDGLVERSDDGEVKELSFRGAFPMRGRDKITRDADALLASFANQGVILRAIVAGDGAEMLRSFEVDATVPVVREAFERVLRDDYLRAFAGLVNTGNVEDFQVEVKVVRVR